MTFIQPNKNRSLANGLLIILTVALGVGVFGMVALYNATVNLDHNMATAKAELDKVGAETTKLSNRVVAALSDGGLVAVAAQDGLVQEQKPQYFQISQVPQTRQTWPIASQQ